MDGLQAIAGTNNDERAADLVFIMAGLTAGSRPDGWRLCDDLTGRDLEAAERRIRHLALSRSSFGLAENV